MIQGLLFDWIRFFHASIRHHTLLVEIVSDLDALFVLLIVGHHADLLFHDKDALRANLDALPLRICFPRHSLQ